MTPGRAAWVVGLGALAALASQLPGLPGALAVYPLLGVAPGLAVATLLAWPEPRAVRWLLALALAPVAASAGGWALLAAGLPLRAAAATVGFASALVWLALELSPARRARDAAAREAVPEPRFVGRLALALAVLVALPPLVNAWIRTYSDGWIHAGLAWEIVRRGIPPQDPRFAGLPLNYVWFYNLYLAMLTSLRGHDPFWFMTILNAVNLAVGVKLAARLCASLWESAEAARGGALLFAFGLNAGAWMLWPLNLIPAVRGEVRGLAEVHRVLSGTWLGDARILYALGAPFAHMVSFLDKFLLGTALNTAWIMAVLWLWATVEWVRRRRVMHLAWAAAAMSGLWLFHLVPGYALLPVALGTLALALALLRRWPWLPAPGALAALAAASAAGALAVLPYALSVSRGWRADSSGLRHEYLRPGLAMPWTLITACGVVLWFARRPLARVLSERRPERALIALFLLAMTGFACLVHLPEDNESKFVFLVFVPLTALASGAFLPEVRGWIARWGRARAALALGLLFAVTPTATIAAYLHDPRGRESEALHPRPGEERLYAWVRDSTEVRAVFVDNRFRDLIMVKGQRRLLYGSRFGPERAAFPAAQVVERRAVMADLYGPAAAIDDDVRLLVRLGAPAYVVYRPFDFGAGAPWTGLERRPDRFRLAYGRDGFLVYRLLD